MVNVKIDGFEMEVEVCGSGRLIMSELCCIVDQVCERFTEEEEKPEEMRDAMITLVASALKSKVRENAKNRK